MTISLGGIILDDHLALDGVDGPSIAMSVRRTFGAPVVQQCAVTAGKTMVLRADKTGNDMFGLFTKLQRDQIAVLRDAGSSVALVHDQGSWTVIIPPDGIKLTQVDDYVNPGDTAEYIGTITMITV